MAFLIQQDQTPSRARRLQARPCLRRLSRSASWPSPSLSSPTSAQPLPRQTYSPEAERKFANGLAAYAEGDYGEALSALEEVSAMHSNQRSSAALLLVSRALVRLERYREALEAARRIEIDYRGSRYTAGCPPCGRGLFVPIEKLPRSSSRVRPPAGDSGAVVAAGERRRKAGGYHQKPGDHYRGTGANRPACWRRAFSGRRAVRRSPVVFPPGVARPQPRRPHRLSRQRGERCFRRPRPQDAFRRHSGERGGRRMEGRRTARRIRGDHRVGVGGPGWEACDRHPDALERVPELRG